MSTRLTGVRRKSTSGAGTETQPAKGTDTDVTNAIDPIATNPIDRIATEIAEREFPDNANARAYIYSAQLKARDYLANAEIRALGLPEQHSQDYRAQSSNTTSRLRYLSTVQDQDALRNVQLRHPNNYGFQTYYLEVAAKNTGKSIG